MSQLTSSQQSYTLPHNLFPALDTLGSMRMIKATSSVPFLTSLIPIWNGWYVIIPLSDVIMPRVLQISKLDKESIYISKESSHIWPCTSPMIYPAFPPFSPRETCLQSLGFHWIRPFCLQSKGFDWPSGVRHSQGRLSQRDRKPWAFAHGFLPDIMLCLDFLHPIRFSAKNLRTLSPPPSLRLYG